MSIWLPQLALDRWSTQAAKEALNLPLALIRDSAHGPRIVAINALARDAGVTVGARVADARGLCPALTVWPHDASGDHAFLEQLALWAQRWGPTTAIDPPDGVLADITGASHLFGGEAALGQTAISELSGRGFIARYGIAQTASAAWALSHFGGHFGSHHAASPTIIAENGDPLDWLGQLPVAAMRLDDDVLLLLRRLGLKRITDIAGLHRDALARRFRNRSARGANPLIKLDQMLGHRPEPLLPITAVEMPCVTRRLIEPLLHQELLDRVITDLGHDLGSLLETQRLGARRILLRAWRVDGDRIERQLELAGASRDAVHITRLMIQKCCAIDAGFGIDQVQLLVPWAEPLALTQGELDEAAQGGSEQRSSISLSVFVDRITTRLGKGAIARPVAYPSHYPERSQRNLPPMGGPVTTQGTFTSHNRPIKLLDQPEPIAVIYATPKGVPRSFRWRGKMHSIVRAEGPERIAPEWWRESSRTRLRDYYRIEDESGRRYWIYRHGVFDDGRGDDPLWYLQGMFG